MTYDELAKRFKEVFEIASWDETIPYGSPGWKAICELDDEIADAVDADTSAPDDEVSEAEWSGETDANDLSHLGGVSPRELSYRVIHLYELAEQGLNESVFEELERLTTDMGLVDAR